MTKRTKKYSAALAGLLITLILLYLFQPESINSSVSKEISRILKKATSIEVIKISDYSKYMLTESAEIRKMTYLSAEMSDSDRSELISAVRPKMIRQGRWVNSPFETPDLLLVTIDERGMTDRLWISLKDGKIRLNYGNTFNLPYAWESAFRDIAQRY